MKIIILLPLYEKNSPDKNKILIYLTHIKTILHNDYNIACELNESGFIRLTFPPHKSLENSNILKLRLNYWNHQVNIIKESVHTHPLEFHSYQISGSYKHELFTLNLNANCPAPNILVEYDVFEDNNLRARSKKYVII